MMRVRKSTFVLAIILASLLFYIFVIDLPSEKEKKRGIEAHSVGYR